MSTRDDDFDLPLDERPGPARRISDRARREAVDAVLDAAIVWPLDDRAGPALPLRAAESEAMIEQILARALPALQATATDRLAPTPMGMGYDDETPLPKLRAQRSAAPRWFAFAAAAGLLLGLAGLLRKNEQERGAAASGTPATLVSCTSDPRPEVAQDETSGQAAAPAPSVVEGDDALRGARRKALARAEASRAAKNWKDAHAQFEDVALRASGTEEGDAALLAMAALRLGPLSDPAGALRIYDAMSARRGPRAAEALFGVAQAARSLGRRATEREALRAIVREHPESPVRAAAEARLSQIDP